MACLPESNKCERRSIDPFIRYLNNEENHQYVHERCLDIVIRDRPQPEVLYRDTQRNETLVIERKNIIWPLDYAERHQAEHFLMDILIEGLNKYTEHAPYVLSLKSGFSINRKELKSFAEEIISKVIPVIKYLEPGQEIRSNDIEKGWSFWLQCDGEREYFEPSDGLIINLLENDNTDLDDPQNIPQELYQEIKHVFQSCERKFAEYINSRRILLIDQHGEMRHLNVEWWRELFSSYPPPDTVPEIWLGFYDWITDLEEGWMFERLWTIVNFVP